MKNNLFSKVLILLLLPMCFYAQVTIYVATNGSTNNSGTSESSPTTLENALNNISSGGTIYVKGGIYNYSSSILIISNGSVGSLKKVVAYNGSPILRFSSMPEASSNRGVVLDGDYWHWKGITIEEAGDNGMLLSGNNNIIENCIFRKNHDTGLQLSRYNTSANSISQWPSNNVILNCEAHDNRDSDNEDADGFAAKLTCGIGNVFQGCVAHHNIDDGWDLYTKSSTGPIGVVTFIDCIAHNNGTLSDGASSGNGDKNGFKLGSSAHKINHIVRRCIAYKNGKHGFTDNGNIGTIEFSNNTSYANVGYNWHTRDGGDHIFKNNVSFGTTRTDRLRGDFSAPNSFVGETGGFTVTSSDFETLSEGPSANPTSNGFLNLKEGSDLIDAGVTSTGIAFNGSSPDLGAIEFGEFMAVGDTTPVIINEIDLANNWVELYNPSTDMVDVSQHRLCRRPTYAAISDLTILSGSMIMTPGSYLVIEWSEINTTQGELGLYMPTGSFDDLTNIIDYVQYGGVLSPTRAQVAVDAGVWDDVNRFVPIPVNPLNTLNNFNQAARHPKDTNSNHWSEGTATQYMVNDCIDSYTLMNATRLINPENGRATYKTNGDIESSQLIKMAGVVDYNSSSSVILLDGFDVVLGAHLLVYIEGCDGDSGEGESELGDRIEESDPRTIDYDGSIKNYTNADNGKAINLSNKAGKEIKWNYTPSIAGRYQVTLRYTRKVSMNDGADIFINGSSQMISFPVTNSSEFTTTSITSDLSSGSNTIILRTSADGESADIDWIEFHDSQ